MVTGLFQRGNQYIAEDLFLVMKKKHDSKLKILAKLTKKRKLVIFCYIVTVIHNVKLNSTCKCLIGLNFHW